MIRHAFLSLPRVPVDMHGQPRDRLRQHPDAGIDRGKLHAGLFVDRLPRRRTAEEEGQSAEVVLRLVPRPEQPAEEVHEITLLWNDVEGYILL